MGARFRRVKSVAAVEQVEPLAVIRQVRRVDLVPGRIRLGSSYGPGGRGYRDSGAESGRRARLKRQARTLTLEAAASVAEPAE